MKYFVKKFSAESKLNRLGKETFEHVVLLVNFIYLFYFEFFFLSVIFEYKCFVYIHNLLTNNSQTTYT